MPNGQTTPWQLWMGPLSWWGVLIGLVLFAQFCLGSLFRKQWVEHEKLMFPHVAVVTGLLEPSEDMDRPVYQVRLFWFGVGASVILLGIDGLNAYFPEIPKIGFANISLSEILNDYPWRALGGHRKLSIQPFIVSISYLVTTEISFSIWIFAILVLVSRVMAWSLTLTTPTRNAWIGEGTINSGATHFGAIIVFIGVFLWSGRRHFRDVLLHATGGKTGEDRDELLPHILAFWGFWFSVAGLLFWCWMVDIPLWFSALVFCVYSVMVLFASRLIAETSMVKMQLWLFRSHKWTTSLVGYKSGGRWSARVDPRNSFC